MSEEEELSLVILVDMSCRDTFNQTRAAAVAGVISQQARLILLARLRPGAGNARTETFTRNGTCPFRLSAVASGISGRRSADKAAPDLWRSGDRGRPFPADPQLGDDPTRPEPTRPADQITPRLTSRAH